MNYKKRTTNLIQTPVLGIIPARGGSKGLPGKNVCLLGGIPLILHTVSAARKAKTVTDFIISTDDPGIARVVKNAGVPVPFLRPTELAKDKSSVWLAIRHAVAYWEKEKSQIPKTIVILQPTSPLRTGGDIDACVRRLWALNADLCATVTVSHDNPYFNMLQLPSKKQPFARPLCGNPKASTRRQDAPPVYALNGAVYALKRNILSHLKNPFALSRFAVSRMPRSRSVDIDTEEDLVLAEYWFRQKK